MAPLFIDTFEPTNANKSVEDLLNPKEWKLIGEVSEVSLTPDYHLSELEKNSGGKMTKNKAIVSVSQKLEKRAISAINEIEIIKQNMVENIFRLGELLSEIRGSELYKVWGFGTFSEWIVKSGLDMGERQAHYLIRIVDHAKLLNIDSKSLKKVKVSKLKEIFTLDPIKHAEDIKLLVEKGQTSSLEEIKEYVQTVQKGSGEEVYTYLNIKVLKSVKDKVIDPAIEIARREYGSSFNNETGEVADIPMGRALELICADYTADPNRQEPTTIEVQTIPVEEGE